MFVEMDLLVVIRTRLKILVHGCCNCFIEGMEKSPAGRDKSAGPKNANWIKEEGLH